MSYYKTNNRVNRGSDIYKSLRPILNVLKYFVLAIGFLFISVYLILGKNETSSNSKSDNIENVESKVQDSNVQEASNNQGNGVQKEFSLTVDTVSVYLTKEGRAVELPLEEYIKGVISSEMPVTFEMEALKSQAIAARTYTLAHTKALGSGNHENGKGADLCDTVHCQVYMTKEARLKAWGVSGEKNWAKIEEAVNSTKGMVLTYNNELAKGAYYFSTSGGKTENVEEVFVNALPYLKSVDSPGEEISPSYKSSVTIPISKFVNTINNQYKDAGVSTGKLKSQIKINSKTEGGSVKEIKLGNITIPGKTFRVLFNLKSANFQLEILDKDVVINCIGSGHGVGMSQWGANVMAKAGKNYKDILKHYYSGVEIKTVNK